MTLKTAATVLGLVVLLVASIVVTGLLWLTRSYSVRPGESVFQVVLGTWAWASDEDGCTQAPKQITVTPDHRTMDIVHVRAFRGADGEVDSVTTYEILSHDRTRIRARIPGELRTTRAGDPVVWDLVLRSPNRLAWHRTDWSWFDFTGDLVRCSHPPLDDLEGTASASAPDALSPGNLR